MPEKPRASAAGFFFGQIDSGAPESRFLLPENLGVFGAGRTANHEIRRPICPQLAPKSGNSQNIVQIIDLVGKSAVLLLDGENPHA